MRPCNGPFRATKVRVLSPSLLTVHREKAWPELADSVAEHRLEQTARAYRCENNDRTGSAWRRASGFPSPQAGPSRNLGGVVFSMGVQYLCGPGIGVEVPGRVQVVCGPKASGKGTSPGSAVVGRGVYTEA